MSFTLLLAAATVAAVLSALLTPLSAVIAWKMGAVDMPGWRKSHLFPTPRLGGLAVYVASSVSLLLFFPTSDAVAVTVTGGGIITALGVSDDVFDLPPFFKLAVEGAAALLPILFGLAPRFLALSAGRTLILPTAVSVSFCFLWTLLLTNAVNLIDGLDGLAASQVALSAFGIAAVGTAPAALSLVGAAWGFLPYNKSRARVFMGDSGALFLGYALAVFSLGEDGAVSPLLPFFFALPLFDLGTAFFRRLFAGKDPFSADNGHLHHRLARAGYGKRGAVLFLFFLSAFTVLGATAFLLLDAPLLSSAVACFLLFALPLACGLPGKKPI